jgi:hypothetical protein
MGSQRRGLAQCWSEVREVAPGLYRTARVVSLNNKFAQEMSTKLRPAEQHFLDMFFGVMLASSPRQRCNIYALEYPPNITPSSFHLCLQFFFFFDAVVVSSEFARRRSTQT